ATCGRTLQLDCHNLNIIVIHSACLGRETENWTWQFGTCIAYLLHLQGRTERERNRLQCRRQNIQCCPISGEKLMSVRKHSDMQIVRDQINIMACFTGRNRLTKLARVQQPNEKKRESTTLRHHCSPSKASMKASGSKACKSSTPSPTPM